VGRCGERILAQPPSRLPPSPPPRHPPRTSTSAMCERKSFFVLSFCAVTFLVVFKVRGALTILNPAPASFPPEVWLLVEPTEASYFMSATRSHAAILHTAEPSSPSAAEVVPARFAPSRSPTAASASTARPSSPLPTPALLHANQTAASRDAASNASQAHMSDEEYIMANFPNRTRAVEASFNSTRVHQNLDCITEFGKWMRFKRRPVIANFGVERDHKCGIPNETFALQQGQIGSWFAWVPPPSCPWVSLSDGCQNGTDCEFDRRGFCRALRGRKLLLVGDSIQYLMHNSILSTFFSKRSQVRAHHHKVGCGGHDLCSQLGELPSTMMFIRNDLLVRPQVGENADAFTDNVQIPRWLQYLRCVS
jgi:hypothetical protein